MSKMNAEILFTARIIHPQHLEQKQMVAIDTQLGTDSSKPENHKGRGWRQQDHTMKLSYRSNLRISYLHKENCRT
jgi:hypothetical protein